MSEELVVRKVTLGEIMDKLDSMDDRLIRVEIMAEEQQSNMKTVKEIRRNHTIFVIGLLTGLLGFIFGSIWYIRGLSAEIQIEKIIREQQISSILSREDIPHRELKLLTPAHPGSVL